MAHLKSEKARARCAVFHRGMETPPPTKNEVVCAAVAPKRGKDKAGENEKKDIRAIVAAINARNPAGLKICDAFQQRFSLPLLAARERPGNRGVHYDFEIQIGDAWFRVEHKGCQQYTPISPSQTPWSAGVQFHNGGCEKYTIARLYAQTWYDVHVGSGALKAEFGVEAPLPTFDEWFAGDAKAQDDPRTLFGVELKKRVKAARGDRASLLDKRAATHAAFTPTAEDFETFKHEVLRILNSVLEVKDYWLTIHGDVGGGDFHCAWYPKFLLSEIKTLVMRKELDIWFDFDCGDLRFSSILRWGKGAGFSNLRIDARDTAAK